jgi:hypothetical protein
VGRVYATEAQLIAYGAPPGVTVPTGAAASWSLARASEHIDDLLTLAVYDTDVDGLPTDTAVVEAVRDATCAQVVWWAETGYSATGAPPRYKSVSLGSLSLTKSDAASAGSSGDAERYAPTAVRHLRLAGLLDWRPQTTGLTTGWW